MRAASPISVAQADPYVRRVAGVCDMHRVAVGSAAELEGFLTALDQDKHLAMDFWAIMGKMSEEGPAYLAGRTLNARMLEVVVEAVTGSSVADILGSGEKPRHVMAQLVRLLAGEDIHSPVVVDDPVGDDPAPITPIKGVDEGLRAAETDADVQLRKPMARAESSVPAAGGAAGAASSLRPFRNSTGELERLPVELRPLHRPGDEAPASNGERSDEAASGQTNAGAIPRREGVRGTTIRWPYEPAAPEPFAQPPSGQQQFVPQRETSRQSVPQSPGPQFGTTRASFVPETPPAIDNPALSDEERLERLRLVQWVLENFPAPHGGAAVRAEADYYGAKVSAAEIFARYAEYRSRTSDPQVERPTAVERVGVRPVEERNPESNRADNVWVAKPYWRTPEEDRSHDPNAQLLPPAAEILPAKAREIGALESNDDASIRVPLSDWEDEEEEGDLQRRAFAMVLSVIVAGGILVGLLMAQVHVVEGWRNLRGSISDRLDALTHRDRSALDIPNALVVDPRSAPVEPPAPTRRTVRPPQARAAAPATPVARSAAGADRPLVRVLPAPVDRIDPVPGAREGMAYETVLRPGAAASGSVPVSPQGSGPITVSAGVMEGYLLVSRAPVFPEGARDGRVVLQAIISKNGSVGHLRVLSGDPVLRGAAADAVAKWRYRPYLVNNEPVEVSTTVTVDFSHSQ